MKEVEKIIKVKCKIEISEKISKVCSPLCQYRDSDYCILYRKNLKAFNLVLYNRCRKCIKDFGV